MGVIVEEDGASVHDDSLTAQSRNSILPHDNILPRPQTSTNPTEATWKILKHRLIIIVCPISSNIGTLWDQVLPAWNDIDQDTLDCRLGDREDGTQE